MAKIYSRKKTAQKWAKKDTKKSESASDNAYDRAVKRSKVGHKVGSLSIKRATTAGTDCLAQWKSGLRHIDHFDADWEYLSKGQWVQGNNGLQSVDPSSKVGGLYQATFGVSDESVTKIRVRIRPVAKTRKVKYSYWSYATKKVTSGKNKGKYQLTRKKKTVSKDIQWWDGDWCSYVEMANPYFTDHASDAAKEAAAAPSAPSGVSAKLQDDGSVLVSWSALDTSTTTSVNVYRELNGLGYWGLVAGGVSASSTSWTDTSARRGMLYAYAVEAVNANGAARSEATDEVQTIPLAPKAVAATRVSDTSFRLDWTDEGVSGDSYEIYWSKTKSDVEQPDNNDGKTTVSFDLSTSGEGSYTVGSIDSAAVIYVSIRRISDGGKSTVSNVLSVAVGSTAAAPTPTSSFGVVKKGETVELTWVHNCEDGSAQTKAHVTVKAGGTTLVDKDIATSNMYYELDTSSIASGTTVTWTVATAGVSGVLGPACATQTFEVMEPPTIAMSLKDGAGSSVETGGMLSSLPVTVGASTGAADGQKVIEWDVSIKANGAATVKDEHGDDMAVESGDLLYEAKLYSGDEGFGDTSLSLVVTALECTWAGGLSYTVEVNATMDNGLAAASASSTVTLGIVAESIFVGASAIPAEDWTAHIYPYAHSAGVDGDELDTLDDGVVLAVYRIDSDGGYTELASNLANSGSCCVTDPFPNFGTAYYRIVATRTATDEVASYDVDVPIDYNQILIQWGARVAVTDEDGDVVGVTGSHIELPYNLKLEEKYAKDVELKDYSGREHSVSYYGTHVSSTGNWKADIGVVDDQATLMALRRLANFMGDCYVREPSGLGYWATVDVSGISSEYGSPLRGITLEVTQVDGRAV